MTTTTRPRTASVLAVVAIAALVLASGIAVVTGADIVRYVPLLLMVLGGLGAVVAVDAAQARSTTTSA